MINRTQQEIMQNWQTDQMTVSITCVAFNHENYMHKTLDSFLMQETTFPFEILINDDASTDKTIEILKSYEEKYPAIVKPVYQKENQYSQGINTMAILFPYVTGKYVAFCDGDDYWIDKEKLQIQVTEMEKHPEIDLCFHSSYRVIDGVNTELLGDHANHIKIFPVKNSIIGHGDFAETASMMFTQRLIASLPEWFITASPGDYVSEVMGAERGGSLFINRTMSAYRSGVAEGWTEQESKKSTAERRESLQNIIAQLEFLDEYLNLKHHEHFAQVIRDDIFSFITSVDNSMEIKKEIYNLNKSSFTLSEQLKWHLLFRHQSLIETIKYIKNSILSLRNPKYLNP